MDETQFSINLHKAFKRAFKNKTIKFSLFKKYKGEHFKEIKSKEQRTYNGTGYIIFKDGPYEFYLEHDGWISNIVPLPKDYELIDFDDALERFMSSHKDIDKETSIELIRSALSCLGRKLTFEEVNKKANCQHEYDTINYCIICGKLLKL